MAVLKGEGTHTILYGSADIHNGLRSNRGYLARPDHAGTYPTLLISHDWSGITPSLKALARSLARYGYSVVAPDYYRGQGAGTPWPADRIAIDLESAYRFLSSSDTPWAGPLAVLGLGAGASAAIEFVVHFPSVEALILVSPLTTFGLSTVAIPTLGIYGKEDQLAESWEQARDQAPQVEWVLYGGAGHDLLDEGSDSYDEAIGADAFDRIRKFLDSHLAGNAATMS